LAFFALLTIVFTWPLASRAGTHTTPHPDAYGHLWGLTWVLHQGLANPLKLYDSNMYYPQQFSLAYTETLFPQALLALPVRLLGASDLLTYNWALLLTFPLSGWGAYLLGKELSGRVSGGLIAGIGFAFNAFRWSHIIHLGVLSVEFFPFVILFLLRSLRRPSLSNLSFLYASALAQALSSGYYTVLLGFAALGVLASTVPAWSLRSLGRVAAAFTVMALTLFALTWPYLVIRKRAPGASRSLGQVMAWSARPSSYLDPGSLEPAGLLTPASWLNAHVAREGREVLYPGALILLLAPVGLFAGRRAPETWTALAVAGVGFLLSIGPFPTMLGREFPGPFLLLRRLPLVDMIRVPSRFGVLTILGLDLLAAIGLGALLRMRSRAVRITLACGAFTLLLVDLYPVWLPELVQPLPPARRTAAWLANAPRGPVLELPTTRHVVDSHDSLYLVWSTQHWQKMVNGYGSFAAQKAEDVAGVGNAFPAPVAVRKLQASRVRYVVVHLGFFTPDRRRHFLSKLLPEGVRLAADFGEDKIYTID
jgi:hypothetical protein